jgi:hypothetical protein
VGDCNKAFVDDDDLCKDQCTSWCKDKNTS